MEPPVEIDPSFEPQQRARSNTWPLPRPEDYVEKEEGDQTVQDPAKPPDASQLPKKNSSRRNAWGNMSYADLITQAIQGTPEKRLTLSQIYDWMVQNVPYFKDKGDSNSSAGWKNSIRHNLSLHNRFMRVQNEGTGKSSWWMINPDAKPGKTARRRATSMETSKYEKKRGRVKKKVEQLRNGLNAATPSPTSSMSEGFDIFPESPHTDFQMSPANIRVRANSNASSCGRLSPISAAVEPDLHDASVPPMSPWNQEYGPRMYQPPGMDRYSADQLVDMAEGMKLGEGGYMTDCQNPTQLSPHGGPMAMGSNGYSMGPSGYPQGYDYPRYHESGKMNPGLPRSPQRLMAPTSAHQDMTVSTSYNITNLQALSPAQSAHSLSPSHNLETLSHNSGATYSQEASAPAPTTPDSMMSPISSGSHSYPPNSQHYCALPHPPTSQGHQPDAGMLRAALTNKDAMSAAMTMSHMRHLMGDVLSSSNMPNDLDLSLETLHGGFDCNVDEVIKHELSMDGNLDFNFPHSGHHSHLHHPHGHPQQQQHHHHQHHQHQQQQTPQHHSHSEPQQLQHSQHHPAPVNQHSLPPYTTPGRPWVR